MAMPEAREVVEVVCALPDEQSIVEVELEDGMTAVQAVEVSGLMGLYASRLESGLVLGVWGVEVETTFVLKAEVRVEISRPLRLDPRVMRREFMSDGRVMGGAGFRKKDRA